MSLPDDAADILAALESKGRIRGKRIVAPSLSSGFQLDEVPVHNFSSNDYLGLAGDVRLQEAAIAVMQSCGFGATASRLIMTHEIHEELEQELAAWLHVEGVQLFNSGYVANVGVLSTIAGRGDVIFSDALNHASIVDGCRLSRADIVIYRHRDLDSLGAALERSKGRRQFIVSESIFSMDGDVADVVELQRIAQHHGATFVLDEAHAIGVAGPAGRGIAAACGVVPDVLVGTLGKAFGCYGAFAATSATVARWLWNRARPLVYSTGLPPMVSGAAVRALEIIRGVEGDRLRAQVAATVERVTQDLAVTSGSHIVPWLVGGDDDAVALSSRLLKSGIFAQAIRPPTVPEGTARLRIALGTQSNPAVQQLVRELQHWRRAVLE
jgi:8-amino-7-oxononanoate synthase